MWLFFYWDFIKIVLDSVFDVVIVVARCSVSRVCDVLGSGDGYVLGWY